MKFSFSTKDVHAKSFLELCNTASEYQYSAFEIYDCNAEKKLHEDSIFANMSAADSKRKLVNRHIELCAVTFPEKIVAGTGEEKLEKYVEYAAYSSCANVICSLGEDLDEKQISKIFAPALDQS